MKDGIIHLENHALSATTTRTEFLSWGIDSGVPTEHDGYMSYDIPEFHVGERKFAASAIFHDETLVSVSLVDPGDHGNGWDDINDKLLERAKQHNDDWLRREYGIIAGRHLFPGGQLESVADLKTGAASIVVRYEQPRS
jgi:hypothetical protein